MKSNIRYCPNCNYAILLDQIKRIKYDYDCPQCEDAPLKDFRGIDADHLQNKDAAESWCNYLLQRFTNMDTVSK